jgi:integrase
MTLSTKKTPEMEKVIKRFYDHLSFNRISGTTRSAYCSSMFFVWRWHAGKGIDFLLDSSVDTLKGMFVDCNHKQGRMYTIVNALRSFFLWANEYGVSELTWIDGVRFGPGPVEKEYVALTGEQLAYFRQSVMGLKIPEYERLGILLLIDTGARRHEVEGILGKNIDLEGNTIFLETTKGSKPRYTFFSDRTKPLIEAHLAGLTNKNGPIFTKKNFLCEAVKTASALTFPFEGRFSHLTPHDLRHTWITLYLAGNGSLAALPHIIGWANLNMLKVYEHLRKDSFKKAYQEAMKNTILGEGA